MRQKMSYKKKGQLSFASIGKIPAFHAGGPGSIPGVRRLFFSYFKIKIKLKKPIFLLFKIKIELKNF